MIKLIGVAALKKINFLNNSLVAD